MANWLECENLIIHNTGSTPTFKRREQASIIDITLSFENIASSIKNWKVLDDVETLSFHQYISFEISKSPRFPTTWEKHTFKGWIAKPLDTEVFKEYMTGKTVADDNELNALLKEVCDKTMKRKSSRKREEMYWWNNSIKDKRAECIKNRRRFTRLLRSLASTDECNRCYEEYKRTRRELKLEISLSKAKCWKELCLSLEKDVWGNAYKIVTNKVGRSPPIIPPDIRKTQLDNLFPNNPISVWKTREVNTEEIEDINTEEMLTVSLKIAPNKAPGPDHIPPKVIRKVAIATPDVLCKIFNDLLKKGSFPKPWKEAKVILLQKPTKNKGDLPSNPSASSTP